MGVAFKDIIISHELKLSELKGKVVAIDSFNMFYQFLTTIRQRDGSLLVDSSGNVTSVLIGLLSRIPNFLSYGLKPVFVFDGQPPQLKIDEINRRNSIKKDAHIKFKKAEEDKDLDSMKKYASMSSRLTPEIIESAKVLIHAFGIPIIQAPSEGEAQASFLVKNNDAYAVISQDFDSLLQGASRVIRNVSISGKRRQKATFVKVNPEIIVLSEVLNSAGIDQDQLIIAGMLVGTDYNRAGIKGIGPKNALKLVKKFGKDFDALFTSVDWNTSYPMPWSDIYYQIKHMPVTKEYDLKWNQIDTKMIYTILVDKYEFSSDRVEQVLSKLKVPEKKQKGLGDFI